MGIAQHKVGGRGESFEGCEARPSSAPSGGQRLLPEHEARARGFSQAGVGKAAWTRATSLTGLHGSATACLPVPASVGLVCTVPAPGPGPDVPSPAQNKPPSAFLGKPKWPARPVPDLHVCRRGDQPPPGHTGSLQPLGRRGLPSPRPREAHLHLASSIPCILHSRGPGRTWVWGRQTQGSHLGPDPRVGGGGDRRREGTGRGGKRRKGARQPVQLELGGWGAGGGSASRPAPITPSPLQRPRSCTRRGS